MRTLRSMLRDDDAQVAKRLENIRIANLYDTLDQLGYPNQCLDLTVKPLFNVKTIRRAGRALTVTGRKAPFTMEEVLSHEDEVCSYRTVRNLVEEGCIIVIEGGGELFAGKFGEMTSWGLHQKGARGIVVDGYIRDYIGLTELNEMTDFSICARGTTPIEGRRRWSICATDTVITFPGTLTQHVRIAPGDWIVSGDDGVIVVPDEIVYKVLEVGEDIEYRENEMRREVANGMDFHEASAKYLRE